MGLEESREIAPAQKSHVVAGPGENGGSWRERGFGRRRQYGGGVYDLLQRGEPRGMRNDTRATPPGPTLPPAEAGVLLAWTVGRLLGFGLRGGAGPGVCVCVSPRWLRGPPLGHEKGVGARRLRVDDDSGQRSLGARVELPSGRSGGRPSWGRLNRPGPRFYLQKEALST